MDFRSVDTTSAAQLRSFLFDLARHQDEPAAKEAAGVPYWSPCPASVLGHRAAAAALRAEALNLPTAS
jgi:hypothetical protein